MSMTINGHTFEISHPDKVLFSDARVTKLDMVRYYRKIARYMLPYVSNRPISMQRFPDGIDKDGFYHKEMPEYFPDFVSAVNVRLKENGTQKQVALNNEETIAYVASQGCVTPHVWLSRAPKLSQPDVMIFDLDPPDDSHFDEVREVASQLGDMFRERNVTPYAMLTGSRGVHVIVPIRLRSRFDVVREKAQQIASELVEKNSDICTLEFRKERRKGKIFVDYLRNAYGQTSVAPFALRAVPEASVAVPIAWDELMREKTHPRMYTIHNVFSRLSHIHDPWEGIFHSSVSLATLST